MKRNLITTSLVAAAMAFVVGASMTQPTSAAPCTGVGCVTTGAGNAQTGGTDVPTLIQNITSILLFAIGAVSVIMIVIGGFKYVTSNGNAEQVKSAKNTIMYALIGVVVAIFAYAGVNFIIESFK